MNVRKVKSAFLYVKNIALVLLCLVLVTAILPIPVSAQKDDKSKVVRVGWFDSSYNIKDASGRRTGYCYEYERKIAAYTDWKYDYVEGSWVELLQKLENNEIDVLGGVSYTEERSGKMLFPSYAMGTQEYYLYIRADQIGDFNEDYSYFNGRKIGVNKGTVQAELFRDWAEIHNISANLTELSSSEAESVEMLTSGRLDAYIPLDNYLSVDSIIPVAKIGSSDFYFAVNKNRADLLSELDSALGKIKDENRFYGQELLAKYTQDPGASLFLTSEEKAWLSEHSTIRVGYLDNYPAYCDKDDNNGELTGALKDYLEKASDCFANVNITFETTAYPTISDAQQFHVAVILISQNDSELIPAYSEHRTVLEYLTDKTRS